MNSGVTRTNFVELKGCAITLQDLGQSCPMLFFNANRGNGNKIERKNYELDFSNEIQITAIGEIDESSCNVMHVCGKLFWAGDNKTTSDNKVLWKDVITDTRGNYRITIWKQSLIDTIQHGCPYIITDC